MKKFTLLVAFILPLILHSTLIPGGDVSGTWNVAGSPYYIDGEITIQSGTELEIDPGVEVIFNEHYKLIIYGRLQAVGTETDSIYFMPLSNVSGWHGLRFLDGNLSSLPANEIAYCQFKQGYALGTGDDAFGGAIFCNNTSNLTIDNSYFKLNYCEYDGGAVCLNPDSDVNITNCLFMQNDCGFYGGGIIIYDSAPIIESCTFKSNTSSIFGAGVSSWNNAAPELYNCMFLDNFAGACTGAYFVNSNVKMANIMFINNTTDFGSGAACGLTTSTTEATNVTAVDNVSPLSGGVFWVNGGVLDLHNSILWNNLPENIFVLDGSANVSNSCISDGFAGTAVITDDPQFIDLAGYDLHLSETSPCIDSGNESLVTFPLPAFDLDGNDRILDGDQNGTATIDMGVYEYVPNITTTGFIVGSVTDIDGNPLENAEITAGIYTTQTDIDGDYELEVEAGDYTVSCYLAGYEIPDGIDVTVVAGESVTADFVLTPEATTGFITGIVTDTDGNPLENAEINAGYYLTLTDMNGEYELEVEAGDYTVSCYLSGYQVPDDIDVTVIAGETVVADFILIEEVDAGHNLSVDKFCLLGNYPNPFNPSTKISFSLSSGSKTIVSIYNSNGQIVRILLNEDLSAGIHQIIWNGKDSTGSEAASGIYFYKVTTAEKSLIGRMIMLK